MGEQTKEGRELMGNTDKGANFLERCERLLARAEKDARKWGITFEWEVDQDGCIGCTCESKDCACYMGEPHEVLGCVARNSAGEVLSSLWGICEPSREYRRVVEAKLAVEALREGKYWN